MGDAADDMYEKAERYAYDMHQEILYVQNAEPLYWKTQTGEKIRLQDLDDYHIANILMFLRRKEKHVYTNSWICRIESEINRRKPEGK